MDVDRLTTAHRHSSHHRGEVERSAIGGCFYCLETFAPGDIQEWVPGEETALCPRCGIDSAIGDASGYPARDAVFLRAMRTE